MFSRSRWYMCVLAVLLLCGVALSAERKSDNHPTYHASLNATETTDSLNYTTSWVGNTFGGNDPNFPNNTMLHVPLDLDSIYVTPDGKVFSNAVWDEGGRAVSVFQNGRLISPLNDQNNSPNWNNGGGVAIAADNTHIFVSYSPNGTGVGILNAKDLSNTGSSLLGSSTVPQSHGVFGETISNGKLYVTENDFNLVEVFDTTTLNLVSTFSINNPVRIAVDRKGGIWVSHRDQTPLPATPQGNVYDINGQMGLPTVDHYDASGTWINSISLASDGEVGAIWIDNNDDLLVGDDGPDQNIKIFTNILTKPVLAKTLGVKGGDYAGPVVGRVGPGRFRGITGLGTDRFGNVYVSQSGFGLDMGVGHGEDLQSYSWFGTLNWQLNGLEFVSMGSIDPHSENDIYDANHHFKVDYSRPPGQEATYVADTYDRFRYPQDVRVTSIASTGKIQYIHGKKFLLVGNQSGTLMEMYRFEEGSEIAIPCVAFDYGSFQGAWQDFAVQPLDGEFIWRDLNGDGQMELNEFNEPANNLHRDGAFFWVDTNGDVWQVSYQGENPPYENSIHLRRFLFQGFDEFGAPIYDYNHLTTYNAVTDVPDLTEIAGAVFLPHASEGGTLFVSGNSQSQGSFSQIVRYDNWDKGNRKATWVANIPWDPDPNNTWSPNSFTVADDFLFVDFWEPHYNLVYSAGTGNYVGKFVPGKDVGGSSNVGNTDEWQANSAFRRPDGEYILLQEEDFQAKLLMYRWRPEFPLPKPPVPAPVTSLQATPDDEEALITWPAAPNALIYNVARSTTKGGPYTVVDAGVYQNSVIDVGLNNGQTYYYVVTAEDNTGMSSVNSPELAVTPVAAGTTYEAEAAVLAGGAGIYSCTGTCSGGARVGGVVQGASITFNNVVVPTTGTYAVRIYDVNGNQPGDWGLPQEPTIEVIANGGATITSPPLPFTGSWNGPGPYALVNVPLNAGTNTIELLADPNAPTGDPDIDRIVVAFTPE